MIGARVSLRPGLIGAVALLALAGPGRAPAAHACGCFAPPNPSVPIVQSGERILFAVKDGVVTAHIQIQYSGDPEEFAWLVPMPAVPTLGLGTDEVFLALVDFTQPDYQLVFDTGGCGSSGGGGCAGGELADSAPAPEMPRNDTPLVLRDTIGPYEYAVLEAGDKQPMLDWLSANGFFVPAGTDDAVTPYIRPGGYFLALKLRKGQSAGDLQPVVVEYQSALPQIPIVLTSVAADPDMPVLVWVFGEHRAIPRNYFHAHINDALLDWLDGGSNYFEVVGAALDEADGHHAFITEYAGTTSGMRDRLDFPGRFGDLEVLATIADPAGYLGYLWNNGFGITVPGGTGPYTSQMLAILGRYLPIPPELLEAETTAGRTLAPQDFYLGFELYAQQYPDILGSAYPDFDPAVVTAELEERVVAPTLAAAALFRDYPYLTRLFSILSPEEMTRDPTFSFNPDLPDVSNRHSAVIRFLECTDSGPDLMGPALLVTEQGWELYLPEGTAFNDWPEAPLPASRSIEMLREEGAAEVMTDNSEAILQGVDELRPVPPRSDGCEIEGSPWPGARMSTGRGMGALLLMFGLAVLLGRRRRSRT